LVMGCGLSRFVCVCVCVCVCVMACYHVSSLPVDS
jgi:hypothetical protein